MTIKVSPATRHDAPVIRNEEIASGICALRFYAPELASALQPGQFMNVLVPEDASQILRVPFSFNALNADEGWVEITYQIVGDGTRALSRVCEGYVLDILGPEGNGWFRPENLNADSRILIVGGGLGCAPLVPWVQELRGSVAGIDVVMGAPTANRVIFADEFAEAGAERVEFSTDDGSAGFAGFCTGITEKMFAENKYDAVFTCGPEPMARIVARQANAAGTTCYASLERGMCCGFGACKSCVIDTASGRKSVCMDGPVFETRELMW